jgi:hypothetical protein
MRAFLPLALALALAAVGCVGSNAPAVTKTSTAGAPARTSVLSGATLPAGDLTAPTFKLVGAIAKGGPAYGDGEPSIASSLNGTLYASFPGCDRDTGPGFILPTKSNCPVAPVYRSADGGATWKRLNADDGTLAKDGKPANGDADVTVDAAGTVYVSNLGNGIEAQRSEDGGATWTSIGNVVPPKDRSVDRNWMAAAGPGHVIFNWMGGPENKTRQVGIVTTFDGGRTLTNVTYVGKDIGWEGSVQFAPDGKTAYVPFTQPIPPATSVPVVGLSPQDPGCKLLVAKTTDGGASWGVLDTNITIPQSITSFHFSCMLMAPSLAVTGDGHVVYTWSEEVPDPAGATNTAAVVKLAASGDGGATWSKPFVLSKAPSAIFPWATGGAGDRVAVSYFADNLPGDPDRTGQWDLRAAVVDGIGGAAPKVADTVVDANVHQGGICAEGGACTLTGTDRALLDYFENCLTPDGKMAIVYPSDPVTGGKFIEIRIAVQTGGTPLLVPPSSEG